MNDHGLNPVVIRFYVPDDRASVEKFKCSMRRWEREAQAVIREAPSLIESRGVELIFAEHGNEIVGVGVFQIFNQSECVIYSLGVVSRLWDQGVGTRLKQAIMVEATDRIPGCIFISKVFCKNGRMQAVNRKLNAVTEIDPDDPDYLLTYVTINLEE